MAPISTITILAPGLKTIHKAPYPSISPSNPPLNQSGRTVLLTGGATGIGYAIGQSFIQAHAAKLIIIGRRQNVLDEAVKTLTAHAQSLNSPTTILSRSLDASDHEAVSTLWSSFKSEGIVIDVLVLNHAVPGPVKNFMETDLFEIWKIFEINSRSILDFTQQFYNQGADKKKYLVNVSTSALHNLRTEATQIPTYGLTKGAALLITQQIANHVSSDKLQVVSFHPGGVLTESARKAGVDEGMYDWDDVKLPGNFAVWAATDEAEFLHGRWVAAHWDVDELRGRELRERLAGDQNFLRMGVYGVESIA
ncbi:NAD(P)-binding protein [Rhypophila decipiens]|uniref:NAD(P)-binding protein n=1 Tax=Rhypophila decipiens TaxID=261697 RepID=A0AAN6XZ91_9PEZI|nr:NAD(P)-binding protein [Rhypophila decipiens]